ncbi:MAG TPA: metallophosphoesterase family protein [Candidatus Acidoferrum sp.]|nr:metallophosphoesterase family protein [Candidatus Acidoferrum sp.]
MRLGIISDTHGQLRPEATAALVGSDLILHAGDIGDPAILVELAKLAPVRAVRGNNDRGAWARRIPETLLIEAGPHRVYILHDIAELDADPARAGWAAVVTGHSHKPRNDVVDGVLYFNPGSAGPRRFRLPIAVGRIDLTDGEVRGTVIRLDGSGDGT